ncbi:hypothetical protein N7456_009541 [Penicillium angulare]|uniref:Uncharacterized protein n=1 Tax=Penicillium angulare TaxID=116970 RepID=A0A9W9F4U6_9EURO|nr:hypothetical protein N7456_009541 [Penicillium angulare]
MQVAVAAPHTAVVGHTFVWDRMAFVATAAVAGHIADHTAQVDCIVAFDIRIGLEAGHTAVGDNVRTDLVVGRTGLEDNLGLGRGSEIGRLLVHIEGLEHKDLLVLPAGPLF